MTRRSCHSENQSKFGSEINIHFPGLKGLDKPTVMIFPQIAVCLDCGCAEFTIEENELRLLVEGTEAQHADCDLQQMGP